MRLKNTCQLLNPASSWIFRQNIAAAQVQSKQGLSKKFGASWKGHKPIECADRRCAVKEIGNTAANHHAHSTDWRRLPTQLVTKNRAIGGGSTGSKGCRRQPAPVQTVESAGLTKLSQRAGIMSKICRRRAPRDDCREVAGNFLRRGEL